MHWLRKDALVVDMVGVCVPHQATILNNDADYAIVWLAHESAARCFIRKWTAHDYLRK